MKFFIILVSLSMFVIASARVGQLPALSCLGRVLDAIGPGESLVDEVIAKSGLPTGKLLSLLTMLELKQVILRLPGNRVVRK